MPFSGYVKYGQYIKYDQMMCVGGPLDGTFVYTNEHDTMYTSFAVDYSDIGVGGRGRFQMPTITTVNYTKRKFTNPYGQSFKVLALETLSGEKVIKMLGDRRYTNNPLPRLGDK